ncbi:GPI alpha-1,2-mannosyltransferase 3-like [Saccoglossus kowalevskii]|uniref:Mannosyltransferase n=1 Tax=Saccoglossus kowalevskii TaxID=10224 RepID=A0ABM0GT77_SACKO|nr:PREDICTED: GPI mannosyltransferase 3-like [Saccoglossus kowalevskii]
MSMDTELRHRAPDHETDDHDIADRTSDEDEAVETKEAGTMPEGAISEYENIRLQKEYLEKLIAAEKERGMRTRFVDNVKFSPPRLMGVLLLIRSLNVFLIQTFFVADEYWQSLEVAHQMVFKYGHLTWEWKNGIRGYTHPLIFAAIYKILEYYQIDHPMLLILLPRLVQGMLAAAADVYLYKLAQRLFGSEIAYWVLLSYLTSWFVCYICTRTLSNTMEMILLIFGLYYYAWPTDWIHKEYKEKQYPNFIYLSIAAISFIIRPTAAVVWLPFIMWHFIRSENKVWLIFTGYIPVGICAAAWSAGIDRIFYGKWIFVQYNFFYYNFFSDIGSNYGSHPFYWYMVTGIPIVLGTHLIPLSFGVRKAWQEKKYRPLLYILLWTVVVYSVFSHKEFRFMSSVIPIAMLFCGISLHMYSKKISFASFLILGLLITNLPVALYFGMLHQRGTMDVMPYLQNMCSNAKNKNELPSIVFLMPCHHTPYYSHLHFNAALRFLDCSPNLKNKTNYVEEADRFYKNPNKWLKTRYSKPGTQPSLLVFYTVLKPRIKEYLIEHNYKEGAKFFHTHFPEGRVGKKVVVYRKTSKVPPEFEDMKNN